MRKIILLFLILLFSFSACWANEAEQSNNEKPSLVFIYSNKMGKSGPGKSYSQEIQKELEKRFTQTFSGSYSIILGDEYLKKMNDAGMASMLLAERGDIIPFFKDDNISYIVIMEALPLNSDSNPIAISNNNGVPFILNMKHETSSIILKIIDVKLDKYLYNGTFSYESAWASISGLITKCYKDAETTALIPKLLKQ